MALLIGMLVASYMQASAGLDAMKQFGISSLHAGRLDRLNLLLLDAQSASRGYALTEDPAYRTSFQASTQKIQDTILVIKQDHQIEIKQDHQIEQRPNTIELINKAQALVAHMELGNRLIERGVALDKGWLDRGTMTMDAYKMQHTTMKAELLTENVKNARQSVSAFENARISTVLLSIASLLLLVLVIAQKQKKQELREKINHLLEAENERLEREVRYRTEELTNLATYLTEVREKEKLHLAREMHDELGALLTAAKFDADWIERKLPPESRTIVAQRLVRLRQNLTGGITLSRRIINDLRPALLYDLGLIDALRALIDEFRQGEEIEVKADLPETEPELSEAVSLSLFRIVQEAFTNIRKYARARHVSVALHVTSTGIELSIEDDGVGFDLDSPKLAHHGLAGIKHRVFTHGGELDINTAPDAGVKIRVVLQVDARGETRYQHRAGDRRQDPEGAARV